MSDYKTMYLHLFNAVTDALALMQAGQTKKAAERLISAQQMCEEIYINTADEGERKE